MTIYNHNHFLGNTSIQNHDKINGAIIGVSSSDKWTVSPKTSKQNITSISKRLPLYQRYTPHKPSVSFATQSSPTSTNLTQNRSAQFLQSSEASYSETLNSLVSDIFPIGFETCQCVSEEDCPACGPEPSGSIPNGILTYSNLDFEYEMISENDNNWNIIQPYPTGLSTSGTFVEFTSIINDNNYSGVVDMDINVELCGGQQNTYNFSVSNTGIIVGGFTASGVIKSFETITTADTSSLTISYDNSDNCLECQSCVGENCCGGEWPRQAGECCEDDWRIGGAMDISGVCCGGIWYTYDEEDPSYIEGQCCDNVWRAGEGVCCGDTWHPAENPCPSGQVFLEWGPSCCGCLPEQITDPITEELVNTLDVAEQLCCPPCGGLLPTEGGCAGNCCYYTQDAININGFITCENLTQIECFNKWIPGTDRAPVFTASLCCEQNLNCPALCCSELENGLVDCAESPTINECLLFGGTNSTRYDRSCATTCIGACCDGTALIGVMTQEECSFANGYWMGLGTTSCPESIADCRSPFSDDCCETKVSSGQSLVFHQPSFRKFVPFNDTLRATVTGTTTSPIFVHGTYIGGDASPTNKCNFNHTFLICGDYFIVEPVSYEYGFHNIEAEVCWTQETTSSETLNFTGGNNLNIPLSNSQYGCSTNLVYTGPERTSNSNLILNGSSTIQVNGGPLVITGNVLVNVESTIESSNGSLVLAGNISPQNSSINNLTLSGSSPNISEISGTIQNSLSGLNVIKTGSGVWKLSGSGSNFEGRLKVLSGTVITTSVASLQPGPFGANLNPNYYPVVGDQSSGASGIAALLFDNANISRGFYIEQGGGSQQVIIGSYSGISTIGGGVSLKVGRDIVLQAASNSSLILTNAWQNYDGTGYPTASITIGSIGNSGDVSIDGYLGDLLGTITVTAGTLTLSGDNDYSSGTVINGGEAIAGSLTAFGTGSITVNAGGILNKNGFNITNNIINNGGTILS